MKFTIEIKAEDILAIIEAWRALNVSSSAPTQSPDELSEADLPEIPLEQEILKEETVKEPETAVPEPVPTEEKPVLKPRKISRRNVQSESFPLLDTLSTFFPSNSADIPSAINNVISRNKDAINTFAGVFKDVLSANRQ